MGSVVGPVIATIGFQGLGRCGAGKACAGLRLASYSERLALNWVHTYRRCAP